MSKSKARIAAKARKHARKEAWKLMTPEGRVEWSAKRRKTSKTGYAKRGRERDNGAPMASRTGEGIGKRFVPPLVRQDPAFAGWLRDFWRLTAA